MPGIENFKGHTFHTSRWDYKFTGGSFEDLQNPSLTNLKDKRVGIIGTGATAIQLVPQLAKWSKELYVFQRTPSSVDRRDQCPTDPEWWSKITAKKGWQLERMENFNAFLNNVPSKPDVDMVCDNWSKTPSYSALIGGPPAVRTSGEIADRVKIVNALDLPHQERIRARVDEIVKDKSTAERLKSWYPTWCKRPCFHDDYLPTFNLPHVKLVDTAGKGIDSITEHGVVVGGTEYNVDVLIFSTGYFITIAVSPSGRASMSVIGREEKDMDEKWKEGVATLHGVVSRGFPNMFFLGLQQSSVTASYTYVVDQLSKHIIYIISTALQKAEPNQKVTIEPTTEAEEEWSKKIVSSAGAFAAVAGCTPGYFNREGESDRESLEEKTKNERGAFWGEGIASYMEILEAWRAGGDLNGLDVQVY